MFHSSFRLASPDFSILVFFPLPSPPFLKRKIEVEEYPPLPSPFPYAAPAAVAAAFAVLVAAAASWFLRGRGRGCKLRSHPLSISEALGSLAGLLHPHYFRCDSCSYRGAAGPAMGSTSFYNYGDCPASPLSRHEELSGW